MAASTGTSEKLALRSLSPPRPWGPTGDGKMARRAKRNLAGVLLLQGLHVWGKTVSRTGDRAPMPQVA